MTSKEKVAALRVEMQKNNVDAFIVYSADPHMSEYLPEEWQERAWLSGFLGSAGFVVVAGAVVLVLLSAAGLEVSVLDTSVFGVSVFGVSVFGTSCRGSTGLGSGSR